MAGATKLLLIAFSMIFTENYVLVQFIAICPFLGVSKKIDSSVGMSGAVIFVMTLASAVTWLIYNFIMVPLRIEYLSTIIFILGMRIKINSTNDTTVSASTLYISGTYNIF